jgi:prepilin-type N-terminal cleavage/methylation domain-containing protein
MPPPSFSRPSAWARRSASAGFTLVEVTIAGALMSLCATFAYATILVANRTAVTNRLFTLAQEMARNQIDRIECASPYNPQLGQIPAVLTETVGPPTPQTLPLYIDPTTNATVVTADLTTTITDLKTYNARLGVVTVSYKFRGRNYQVQMNTLRTSDS